MPDSSRLLLFLTAGLLLAIAPGPGMLYVLARSLAGGKRARMTETPNAAAQDSAVLSFLHPTVCEPRSWTRVFPVRRSGSGFCNFEHFGGYDRHPAGGTTGEETPFVPGISPSTENPDGRHHDWAGNLPGDKRKPLATIDF